MTILQNAAPDAYQFGLPYLIVRSSLPLRYVT